MKRPFPVMASRPIPRAGAARVVVVLLILTLLPGCTSPRYKSAPKKTPGPVMLNLPSTEPPIEALLHTVIVYRGPGSWKLDAYWDEYVVTVANRGDALVTIEAVTITDFQDALVTPGQSPWDVETASRAFAEQSEGKNFAVQVGGGLGVLAIGGGVGAVAFSSSLVSASAGAAAGGLLILPAVIGGTIYSNVTNRRAIEREFGRRRLALPATLQPGQLAQGSFFFRISPGPKRLSLACRVDREPHEVVIDLAPLSGMHLRLIPPETTTPAAASPK